jgi:HAE1 family hydrophobic/amphiphilic exporter-1
VSGPVVAIALILSAVFIPVGFMGGITGALYQQFAITIAISVLLSAVNALTLSPALSALLLKPATGKKSLLTPFYNWFNRVFGSITNGYISFTTILVRKFVVGLVLIGGLVWLTMGFVQRLPAGFVPEEDQGYILVNALLPDAASLERTDAVMRKAEAILSANHAVEGYNTISGFSLLTGAYSSNIGFFFVALKPWHDRHSAEEQAPGVIRALNQAFASEIPEAAVVAFGPPAIPGLGTGAGFTMQLQDRTGREPGYLAEQTQRFMQAASQRPEIGRVSTLYRATGTTSTGSAASTRCTCRPSPSTALIPSSSASSSCAASKARWSRSTRWSSPRRRTGPSSPIASICTARRRSPAFLQLDTARRRRSTRSRASPAKRCRRRWATTGLTCRIRKSRPRTR